MVIRQIITETTSKILYWTSLVCFFGTKWTSDTVLGVPKPALSFSPRDLVKPLGNSVLYLLCSYLDGNVEMV